MARALVENAVGLPLLLRFVHFLLGCAFHPSIGTINLKASNHFQIVPTVNKSFFIILKRHIVWLGLVGPRSLRFLILDVVKLYSLRVFRTISIDSLVTDWAFLEATEYRGARPRVNPGCEHKRVLQTAKRLVERSISVQPAIAMWLLIFEYALLYAIDSIMHACIECFVASKLLRKAKSFANFAS